MFPFPVLFLATSQGLVPLPEGIVKKVVAASSPPTGQTYLRSSVAVLLNDGRLFTQGTNNHGELADGTTLANYNTFHLADNNVDQVYAGDRCFIIKRNDGTWKFAGNQVGIGGAGNFTAWADLPANITNNVDLSLVQDIVGFSTSCTLIHLTNGRLYGVGVNSNGCLGSGNNNPISVPRLIATNCKKAAVALASSAYLTTTGALFVSGFTHRLGGAGAPEQVTSYRQAVFTSTGDTVAVKDFCYCPQNAFVVGAPTLESTVNYLYTAGITTVSYGKEATLSSGFPEAVLPSGTSTGHFFANDYLLAMGPVASAFGLGVSGAQTTPGEPVFVYNTGTWEFGKVNRFEALYTGTNSPSAMFLVYDHNLFLTGGTLLLQGSLNGDTFKNVTEFNT